MIEQERQLICNLNGRAASWQYRQDPSEYQPGQSIEQSNSNTGDTWILLFGILGTIAFLVFLVKETI